MDSSPISQNHNKLSSYAKQDQGKKEEPPVWGKIKDFFESNLVEQDKDSGDYRVNKKMYAVAAGETAIGAGVGYKIGADHQANDVVTREIVTRNVSKSVKVGERTVTGGNHYRYGYDFDPVKGEFDYGYHYGYDPNYQHQEPVYQTVRSGERVPVTHHTEKFPYTALQGLLLGSLVGGAIGVAQLLISKLIASNKNS